jgi:hypothetical protein
MQLADRRASGRSVASGNPSGGARALEISYLTGCDDALVTHRCTTIESYNENMRSGWLTPGLS